MKNIDKKDTREKKWIRITDAHLWELIDEISELNPAYKRSFNALLADALQYGLPILIKRLKGQATSQSDNTFASDNKIADEVVKGMNKYFSNNSIVTENQFYAQLVQLLQEVVLNVIISKSLLSSLFNAKELELKKTPVNAERFSDGQYEGTPDYLESYELRELAKIQRQNLN